MTGTERVFTTSPALRVFLLFVLVGQGAILRGSVLLFAVSPPVAVAPGAHCPLTYHPDSQTKLATSHCPMHQTGGSGRAEWRCTCGAQSPTSTSDTTVTYFLVSSLAELLALLPEVFVRSEHLSFFLNLFFSPPDPPPRSFLSTFI